jgi:hypothetical protein
VLLTGSWVVNVPPAKRSWRRRTCMHLRATRSLVLPAEVVAARRLRGFVTACICLVTARWRDGMARARSCSCGSLTVSVAASCVPVLQRTSSPCHSRSCWRAWIPRRWRSCSAFVTAATPAPRSCRALAASKSSSSMGGRHSRSVTRARRWALCRCWTPPLSCAWRRCPTRSGRSWAGRGYLGHPPCQACSARPWRRAPSSSRPRCWPRPRRSEWDHVAHLWQDLPWLTHRSDLRT